jgi:CRP/FNR family transcriptional regulator, cyclic AMP receptor protein
MKKILFMFAEMTDDDIDWIINNGTRVTISTGTILIEQGKSVDALYIILEGSFSVIISGEIDKTIAILGSGEVVGEMSFIDDRSPSATVEALSNSLVLAIPRSLLNDKLKQDVNFAAHFHRAIAIFLSYRLRTIVSHVGYGDVQLGEDFNPDYVPVDTLDNVSLANARFDWLLRRLKQK